MTNPLYNPSADPFAIAREAAMQIEYITSVPKHDIALTLGSGWGLTADRLGEVTHTIDATEIVGFNASQVAGHTGTLKSVLLPNGKRVLIIGARTHYYEGHGVRPVVHSVRTAAACGAKTMVLTNGAGSIRPEWIPGTVILLRDHINLTADSPLEGATFVDLTDLYSPTLRHIAHEVDHTLPAGVYVQNRGPHYETPAEVKYADIIGGDIVGMSTALEAIAAREAGMEVLGLSLITNHAAGTVTNEALNHAEVLQTGKENEVRLAGLLSNIIHRI